MKRIHANEIIRWANSPIGTEVWFKGKSKGKNCNWLKMRMPNWLEDTYYVVDDEYTEVRKAFYDGNQIQINKGNSYCESWIDMSNSTFSLGAKYYRVKPDEPTYYWRWERLSNDGVIGLTDYITDEYAENNRIVEQGYRKIESSKRTWEE